METRKHLKGKKEYKFEWNEEDGGEEQEDIALQETLAWINRRHRLMLKRLILVF